MATQNTGTSFKKDLGALRKTVINEIEQTRHLLNGLEKTLEGLDAISNIGLGNGTSATAAPTANKPGKASKAASKKPVKKVAKKSAKKAPVTASAKSIKPVTAKKSPKAKPGAKSGLPNTGKDFWLEVLTTEPRTKDQVMDAAIKSIGHKISPADKKKLSDRMTFTINSMVRAKEISDSGAGRERTFSLKA